MDYTTVTTLTHSTIFLIVIGLVWFLPLLISLIVGATTRGKYNGTKSKKTLIQTKGFWYLWLLWFFLQGTLIISLVIFPFWTLI